MQKPPYRKPKPPTSPARDRRPPPAGRPTKGSDQPKDPLKQYIGGRNLVREALEAGQPLEKIFLKQGMDDRMAGEIRGLAGKANVPIMVVPVEKLNRLDAALNHQGVVAQRAAVQYWELNEMLDTIAPSVGAVQKQKPLLVLLDQIEDPQNFGAIIRSAVAAGASGLIIPERHMAPLSAVAIKASAGTALRLPIAKVVNMADVIQQLKERGYWVAGLAGTGEQHIWEIDWDRPFALVIGNEGKGMRERVQKSCDYVAAIPMAEGVESLNASVAAGIALFAVVQSRLALPT